MWRHIVVGIAILSIVMCVVSTVIWMTSETINIRTSKLAIEDRVWEYKGLEIYVCEYIDNQHNKHWIIEIPTWVIVALTAAYPLWWFVHSISNRRCYPRDVCAKCGYDLRATPNRCPECGTKTDVDGAGKLKT